MDAYLVGDTNKINVTHAYGDPTFNIRLSDYYVGPDLQFYMDTNHSNSTDNLVLPAVINTYDFAINTSEFHTQYNCRNNVFNRFDDPVHGVMISFL